MKKLSRMIAFCLSIILLYGCGKSSQSVVSSERVKEEKESKVEILPAIIENTEDSESEKELMKEDSSTIDVEVKDASSFYLKERKAIVYQNEATIIIYITSYDKDGKVIRDETQDLSPGDGDSSHISEYEYDDEGLKTHETYSTRGSSEIYSYDIKSVKNGNVITEESYDKEGSLVSKNIYSYNSDDILLSVELEVFDNNGETSFYQKEEYDTKGNKTNVYTVYDKGESWYNNRIENYYEGDELVKQYEYFSNSFSDHEELSRQCLVKNSYDSDGNLIHTVFSNEESEDNTTESEVIYTYQE